MVDSRPYPGLILSVARFFHDPRGSVRGVIDSQPNEGQVLGYCLVGAVVLLVGHLVVLARAFPVGSDVFMSQAVALVSAWLFVMPLLYYALAAIGRLVARAFGGRGDWKDARIAFFWAFLVSSPVTAAAIVLEDLVAGQGSVISPALGQIGPCFFVLALSVCFAEAFQFRRSWLVVVVISLPILLLFAAFEFGLIGVSDGVV